MPRNRLARAAAGVALAAVLLTGCTPTPEPTPTPTGFATDEEAFEAAEATYRAYVDALNKVDLADPKTFEPVFAWTTGEAQANDKKSFTTMHANGWTVSGESALKRVYQEEWSPDQVVSVVCLNVATVTLVDKQGVSQVDPDRRDEYPLRVTFTHSALSPTGLLIAESAAASGVTCG